jgi:hypothetical protein
VSDDDIEAWGMPAFARDFPKDPELDALVVAFARGDYQAVRQRAPTLAASTTDPDVKRAAELLRERIEPDPLARLLFLIAAALLIVLTSYWVLHSHHAP